MQNLPLSPANGPFNANMNYSNNHFNSNTNLASPMSMPSAQPMSQNTVSNNNPANLAVPAVSPFLPTMPGQPNNGNTSSLVQTLTALSNAVNSNSGDVSPMNINNGQNASFSINGNNSANSANNVTNVINNNFNFDMSHKQILDKMILQQQLISAQLNTNSADNQSNNRFSAATTAGSDPRNSLRGIVGNSKMSTCSNFMASPQQPAGNLVLNLDGNTNNYQRDSLGSPFHTTANANSFYAGIGTHGNSTSGHNSNFGMSPQNNSSMYDKNSYSRHNNYDNSSFSVANGFGNSNYNDFSTTSHFSQAGYNSSMAFTRRKRQFNPFHSKTVPRTEDHYKTAENSKYSRTSSGLNENNDSETMKATTIMVRNLPNKYTHSTFQMELNDDLGLKGLYDFLYIPMDVVNKSNVGYCFINFVDVKACEKAKLAFGDRYDFVRLPSLKKTGECTDAHVQGFWSNLDILKNKTVVSAKKQEYRPVVLWRGEYRVKDWHKILLGQLISVEDLCAVLQISTFNPSCANPYDNFPACGNSNKPVDINLHSQICTEMWESVRAHFKLGVNELIPVMKLESKRVRKEKNAVLMREKQTKMMEHNQHFHIQQYDDFSSVNFDQAQRFSSPPCNLGNNMNNGFLPFGNFGINNVQPVSNFSNFVSQQNTQNVFENLNHGIPDSAQNANIAISMENLKRSLTFTHAEDNSTTEGNQENNIDSGRQPSKNNFLTVNELRRSVSDSSAQNDSINEIAYENTDQLPKPRLFTASMPMHRHNSTKSAFGCESGPYAMLNGYAALMSSSDLSNAGRDSAGDSSSKGVGAGNESAFMLPKSKSGFYY